MTDTERLAEQLRALPGVVRVYPTRPTLGERLTRADIGEVAVRGEDDTPVVSADLGVSASASAMTVGLEAVRLTRASFDTAGRARIRIVTVG